MVTLFGKARCQTDGFSKVDRCQFNTFAAVAIS